MKHCIYRLLARVFVLFLVSGFLTGCGYSKEEKQRMKAIMEQGEENAVNFIKEKYGFTPEVQKVQVCKERGDVDFFPWANGYVLVTMSYGEEEFKVHINGEMSTSEGMDDYQYGVIMEEAKEYFKNLLGYEIYDIYLEYQENPDEKNPFPDCHEDYFLKEFYESGSFEDLVKHYPMNVRIDDCSDQDMTDFDQRNPAAITFFEEHVRDYGMKAILISYRSEEDYEKGYDHTYGRGGVLDFGIEEDGLYINSFLVFEENGMGTERFELQEYDHMIFSCADKAEGNDLNLSVGQAEWRELGETEGKSLSDVYSVTTDNPGPVTVYIPTKQYGRSASVYIQHFSKDQWWQYKDYTHITKDKNYLIVTYYGYSDLNASFDFAITLH